MRHGKKLVFALLAALTLIICAVAQDKMPSVTDGAGFLNESQISELTEALDSVYQNYRFDAAIFTESEMSGDDARANAEEIYSCGYGYGESYDGILLYVSASPRKYHIVLCGSGNYLFADEGLSYIEDEMLPFLKNDEYYFALSAFTQAVQHVLENGVPEEYIKDKGSGAYGYDDVYDNAYRYPDVTASEATYESGNYYGIIIAVIGAAVVSLIIALCMTYSKQRQMHTAVKNNAASNYTNGGVNMLSSNDIFLYSTLVKTEKPKDTPPPGLNHAGTNHGGGFSSGSGGRSFGGRGGSY